MTQNYIRKSTHSIEEIFSKVLPKGTPHKQRKVDIDGDLINMKSQRYHTFIEKGCKCVTCGVEGVFFAKERDYTTESYHLNLYGIKDGEEILMTKDHIIPRSRGGLDRLSNYQTMCVDCNGEKKSLEGEDYSFYLEYKKEISNYSIDNLSEELNKIENLFRSGIEPQQDNLGHKAKALRILIKCS